MDSFHSLQCLHTLSCHTGGRSPRSHDRQPSLPLVRVRTDTIKVRFKSSSKSKSEKSRIQTRTTPALVKKFKHKRVKSGLRSKNSKFTHFTHPLAAHVHNCLCESLPNPTTCQQHPLGKGVRRFTATLQSCFGSGIRINQNDWCQWRLDKSEAGG